MEGNSRERYYFFGYFLCGYIFAIERKRKPLLSAFLSLFCPPPFSVYLTSDSRSFAATNIFIYVCSYFLFPYTSINIRTIVSLSLSLSLTTVYIHAFWVLLSIRLPLCLTCVCVCPIVYAKTTIMMMMMTMITKRTKRQAGWGGLCGNFAQRDKAALWWKWLRIGARIDRFMREWVYRYRKNGV